MLERLYYQVECILPPQCLEIGGFLWALRFWVYENMVDAIDTAVVDNTFAEMFEIINSIIDRIYNNIYQYF